MFAYFHGVNGWFKATKVIALNAESYTQPASCEGKTERSCLGIRNWGAQSSAATSPSLCPRTERFRKNPKKFGNRLVSCFLGEAYDGGHTQKPAFQQYAALNRVKMVGTLLSIACKCFQQHKNVGGIEKISCIDTDMDSRSAVRTGEINTNYLRTKKYLYIIGNCWNWMSMTAPHVSSTVQYNHPGTKEKGNERHRWESLEFTNIYPEELKRESGMLYFGLLFCFVFISGYAAKS